MKIVARMIIALALATGVFAQKVDAPKLKPEIELALRNNQVAQYKLVLQQKQIEAQYEANSKELARLSQEYAGKLSSALKDSGIDPATHDLDKDTLAVSKKPEPGKTPPNAANPAPEKK